MEICTSKPSAAAISTLPKLPTFITSARPLSRLHFSRSHRSTTSLRCTNTSEETQVGGGSPYVVEEKSNGFGGSSSSATEESPAVEPVVAYDEKVEDEQPSEGAAAAFPETVNEFLADLNFKFDSEDTVSLVIYGSGALLAVWLLSAVVNAVDSIPVFPKLMEVLGPGYSVWFTSRYLLFKVSSAIRSLSC
ncbi:Protein CURVATURE THYLAKOID 1D, chloroplastic [Linum grandiflorum]